MNNSDFKGMDQDKNGDYWIVTDKNGILQFNEKNATFIYYPDNKITIQTDNIKKILIDKDNTFWITSTFYGLAQFNPQTKEWYYLPTNETGTGINRTIVLDIIEWKDNELLVAVDQGGINKINKKTGKVTYIKADNPQYGKLSSDGIYSFHLDKKGILFV